MSKNIIAKKTFNFGKIDYMDRGHKNCAVDVIAELRECGGEPVLDRNGDPTGEHCNKYIEFAASGRIWNPRYTDIYSCGQNLDEIAKHIKNPIFREIYDFWKKYHLNGMNAGTPEQEAAVKEWQAAGNRYDYTAACEMLKACGLYEVPLTANLIGTRKADGKPYKYGSGRVIAEIPENDIAKIKSLLE